MTTQQSLDEVTHLLRRSLALALDPGPRRGTRSRIRDAIDWLDGEPPARSKQDTAAWLVEQAEAEDERRAELYRIAAVVIRGTP